MFDPATQKLEILQCELEQLRARIAELVEEREQVKEPAAKPRRRASSGDRA
jgi:serine O-acetyltransferase